MKSCRTKQYCSKALDFAEKANFHFAVALVAAKYFRCQWTADSKGSIKATRRAQMGTTIKLLLAIRFDSFK